MTFRRNSLKRIITRTKPKEKRQQISVAECILDPTPTDLEITQASEPMGINGSAEIERYHRFLKNIVKLQHYYSPSQLAAAIEDFVAYYNNQRYHESLDNMTPVSIYYGKDKEVQSEREKIKRDTMILRRQQNLVPVGV